MKQVGTCWIVTDGAVGHVKQCRAVTRYLGVEPEVFEISLRQPWDLLAPYWHVGGLRAIRGSLGDRLRRGDLPDLLLTAGRRSVLAALTIKRLSAGRTFTVQLLNPGIATARFDLVVCPRHDRLRGDNVVSTAGALHDIDETTLAAARQDWAATFEARSAPRVALLIGGPNRAFPLSEADLEALAGTVERIADSRSILVTTAPRTPEPLRDFVRRRFPESVVWTGEADGPNPYLGMLAWADHLFVSADSVNMLSEALGTGKPVYCSPPGEGTPKFKRLMDELSRRGLLPVSKAPATVDYEPLRETPSVAEKIARRMTERAA